MAGISKDKKASHSKVVMQGNEAVFSCDEIKTESIERAVQVFSRQTKNKTIQHALAAYEERLKKRFACESVSTRKDASIRIEVGGAIFYIRSGMGHEHFLASIDQKGELTVRHVTEEHKHGDSTEHSHFHGYRKPVAVYEAKSLTGNQDHVSSEGNELPENKQQRFKMTVEEINKRSMGRAVLKFCGNEGTKDCANKAVLRRLLQAVISHIPEEKHHVWKDAQVTIYDDECDVYTIVAGSGHHKFIATDDGYGNPMVVKQRHGSQCHIM